MGSLAGDFGGRGELDDRPAIVITCSVLFSFHGCIHVYISRTEAVHGFIVPRQAKFGQTDVSLERNSMLIFHRCTKTSPFYRCHIIILYCLRYSCGLRTYANIYCLFCSAIQQNLMIIDTG